MPTKLTNGNIDTFKGGGKQAFKGGGGGGGGLMSPLNETLVVASLCEPLSSVIIQQDACCLCVCLLVCVCLFGHSVSFCLVLFLQKSEISFSSCVPTP